MNTTISSDKTEFEPVVEFQLTPEQVRLQPYFQKVADPKDWKAPILAYIRKEDLDGVLEAVRFYTATEAVYVDLYNGWVQVRADGYRRGPAGDH